LGEIEETEGEIGRKRVSEMFREIGREIER